MRSTTHTRLEDCAAVAGGLIRRVTVLTMRGHHVSTPARRVDVAPHITCAAFVVHEAIGEPGWAVTDASSGARVGFSAESEVDAIDQATAALAARTDDDMAQGRAKLRELAAARGH